MRRLSSRATAAISTGAIAVLIACTAAPANAATTGVIAEGALTNPSGAPVNGARVLLLVEPSAATVAALAVGQSVSIPVVGSATTDSAGHYSIAATDPNSITAAEDPSGIANFRLISPTGTASAPAQWSFAARYDQATGRVTATSVAAAVAKPQVGQPAIVNLRVPTSATTAATRTAATPNDNPTKCNSSYVSSYGGFDTSVARYYSSVSGVKAKFTFTHSATTTLGVGVSASGNKGTYSASGTADYSKSSSNVTTESITSSGPFKTAANTYFVYHKNHYVCTDTRGTIVNEYFAEPAGYDGPLHPGSLSAIPSNGNCYTAQGSYEINLNYSSAQTTGAGVSASSGIGISLSSQSGYSTATDLDVTVPNGRKVCGTTGKASSDSGPGEIVVSS